MSATRRWGFARFRSRSWSILRRFSSTSSRKRPCRTRLFLEPLEDRLLLSASIFGSVWNDLDGNGTRAGEPGVPGVILYLDGNHNGVLDSQVIPVAPKSSAIGPGGAVGTN